MNTNCPECNNDGGLCNFCGAKPRHALTSEMIQKAGEYANKEQRNIFYAEPYEGIKITRVEFKCNICGKWEENETGTIFYKPTICKKCLTEADPYEGKLKMGGKPQVY